MKEQEEYDYKLTAKQEVFVTELIKGRSQYEAYIKAYPNSEAWGHNAVSVAANRMIKSPRVKKALEELGYQTRTEALWTRQRALETIDYVMEYNKKEMERLDRAYEDEIDLLEARLTEIGEMAKDAKTPDQMYKIGKRMQEVTAQITKAKKQRRANTTNIQGIFEGAKILNKMYGLDVTKVEVKQIDEEKEELNKLSAEELKKVLAQVGE